MTDGGTRKALLVTRNFPPLLGGMEKLNQRLLGELGQEWVVEMCGPAGSAQHAGGVPVHEAPTRPLALFLLVTGLHAARAALSNRPEWIVAGSGLTAPIAWLAARVSGGKVAIYAHGLDLVAPSRAYQSLWLPFIRRCDLMLVNSASTRQLAEAKRVPARVIRILHPGVDVPSLDPAAGEVFRSEQGLGQRPVLLSVGRLTRRKGLVEFLENTFPRVVERYPDVILMVIGADANDALHGGSAPVRAQLELAAERMGVASNVKFIGHCSDSALSGAYQAADVHVFPVRELTGDVEGFGMVALESAAHGLPTVAFAVGGVPDAVRDGETGTLVPAGDYRAFADAVSRHLEDGRGRAGAQCRDFAEAKSWTAFGTQLRAHLGQ